MAAEIDEQNAEVRAIKELYKLIDRKLAYRPDIIWLPVSQKVTLDATGNGTIGLEPPPGWEWDIRLITVHQWAGAIPNPSTAFAGASIIYDGTKSPNRVIDIATTLPRVVTFPEGPPMAEQGDPVTCEIIGGPANQDVFFNLYVQARRVRKAAKSPSPYSGEDF